MTQFCLSLCHELEKRILHHQSKYDKGDRRTKHGSHNLHSGKSTETGTAYFGVSIRVSVILFHVCQRDFRYGDSGPHRFMEVQPVMGVVFWILILCSIDKSRRFGKTSLPLSGSNIRLEGNQWRCLSPTAAASLLNLIFGHENLRAWTLCSSMTSGFLQTSRRYSPQTFIL
jgi:hypothetical protein